MDYINANNNIEADLEFLVDFRNEGLSSATWAIETMKKLRENANVYEKKLAKYLFENNVNYYTQVPFKICTDGKRHVYFADFFVPELLAVIEVDGESHDSEERKLRDDERDSLFHSVGVRTIRIRNEKVKAGCFESIPIPPMARTEERDLITKMKRLLLSEVVEEEKKKIDRDEERWLREEVRRREEERRKREQELVRREQEVIAMKKESAPSVVSEMLGTDYYMLISGASFCKGKGSHYEVGVFKVVDGERIFDYVNFAVEWPGGYGDIPAPIIAGRSVLSAIKDGLNHIQDGCSVTICFDEDGSAKGSLFKMLDGKSAMKAWSRYHDELLEIFKNSGKKIVISNGHETICDELGVIGNYSYSALFWNSEDYEEARANFLRPFRYLSANSILRNIDDYYDYVRRINAGEYKGKQRALYIPKDLTT